MLDYQKKSEARLKPLEDMANLRFCRQVWHPHQLIHPLNPAIIPGLTVHSIFIKLYMLFPIAPNME
jgi:hypothetical protein